MKTAKIYGCPSNFDWTQDNSEYWKERYREYESHPYVGRLAVFYTHARKYKMRVTGAYDSRAYGTTIICKDGQFEIRVPDGKYKFIEEE